MRRSEYRMQCVVFENCDAIQIGAGYVQGTGQNPCHDLMLRRGFLCGMHGRSAIAVDHGIEVAHRSGRDGWIKRLKQRARAQAISQQRATQNPREYFIL